MELITSYVTGPEDMRYAARIVLQPDMLVLIRRQGWLLGRRIFLTDRDFYLFEGLGENSPNLIGSPLVKSSKQAPWLVRLHLCPLGKEPPVRRAHQI